MGILDVLMSRDFALSVPRSKAYNDIYWSIYYLIEIIVSTIYVSLFRTPICTCNYICPFHSIFINYEGHMAFNSKQLDNINSIMKHINIYTDDNMHTEDCPQMLHRHKAIMIPSDCTGVYDSYHYCISLKHMKWKPRVMVWMINGPN